jgi:hypothetical protein
MDTTEGKGDEEITSEDNSTSATNITEEEDED